MMSLRIKSPGLLSTIQDTGRWGYQKEGVLVNGAMDKMALRIGNMLVGNQQDAAALEMSQIGPRVYFEDELLIAITGAGLSPTINGQPVKMWRPVWVKKESLLEFIPQSRGRFAYLSLAGGIDVPSLMGSKSTYLRAGFGGMQGRALVADDRLQNGKPAEAAQKLAATLQQKAGKGNFSQTSWFADSPQRLVHKGSALIRFTEGPEWPLFSSGSRQTFLQEAYEVSIQSDRMGYRLSDPELSVAEPVELLSAAVSFGTIQVPPDGRPIVLLADHQTTGGYPRLAQLASADLSSMVQLLPGNKVRFKLISLQQAQQLYMEQEQKIEQINRAISLKFKEKE